MAYRVWGTPTSQTVTAGDGTINDIALFGDDIVVLETLHRGRNLLYQYRRISDNAIRGSWLAAPTDAERNHHPATGAVVVVHDDNYPVGKSVSVVTTAVNAGVRVLDTLISILRDIFSAGETLLVSNPWMGDVVLALRAGVYYQGPDALLNMEQVSEGIYKVAEAGNFASLPDSVQDTITTLLSIYIAHYQFQTTFNFPMTLRFDGTINPRLFQPSGQPVAVQAAELLSFAAEGWGVDGSIDGSAWLFGIYGVHYRSVRLNVAWVNLQRRVESYHNGLNLGVSPSVLTALRQAYVYSMASYLIAYSGEFSHYTHYVATSDGGSSEISSLRTNKNRTMAYHDGDTWVAVADGTLIEMVRQGDTSNFDLADIATLSSIGIPLPTAGALYSGGATLNPKVPLVSDGKYAYLLVSDAGSVAAGSDGTFGTADDVVTWPGAKVWTVQLTDLELPDANDLSLHRGNRVHLTLPAAVNGKPPYVYALNTGPLTVAGLEWNAGTRRISGKVKDDSQLVSRTLTYSVTDSHGVTVSTDFDFAVLLEPPKRPHILPGNTTLTVSWNRVPGALAYRVLYSLATAGADAEPSTVIVVNPTTILTGLTNGLLYKVQVVAVATAGVESHPSQPSTGTPFVLVGGSVEGVSVRIEGEPGSVHTRTLGVSGPGTLTLAAVSSNLAGVSQSGWPSWATLDGQDFTATLPEEGLYTLQGTVTSDDTTATNNPATFFIRITVTASPSPSELPPAPIVEDVAISGLPGDLLTGAAVISNERAGAIYGYATGSNTAAGSRLDPATGAISWDVPASQAAGDYTLVYRVVDEHGQNSNDGTITFTIEQPPAMGIRIDGPTAITLTRGEVITSNIRWRVVGTIPDGANINWSFIGTLPDGVALVDDNEATPRQRRLTGTPSANLVPGDVFTITHIAVVNQDGGARATLGVVIRIQLRQTVPTPADEKPYIELFSTGTFEGLTVSEDGSVTRHYRARLGTDVQLTWRAHNLVTAIQRTPEHWGPGYLYQVFPAGWIINRAYGHQTAKVFSNSGVYWYRRVRERILNQPLPVNVPLYERLPIDLSDTLVLESPTEPGTERRYVALFQVTGDPPSATRYTGDPTYHRYFVLRRGYYSTQHLSTARVRVTWDRGPLRWVGDPQPNLLWETLPAAIVPFTLPNAEGGEPPYEFRIYADLPTSVIAGRYTTSTGALAGQRIPIPQAEPVRVSGYVPSAIEWAYIPVRYTCNDAAGALITQEFAIWVGEENPPLDRVGWGD